MVVSLGAHLKLSHWNHMQAGSEECQLLVGPSAIAAQVLLVAIVVLGLLYKRNTEVPPRPLLIWGMDVSKQLVSSGMAHLLGMLIAILAQLRATEEVTTRGLVQKRASSCQGEWSSSDEDEMAEDMEQHLTGRRLRVAALRDPRWLYESIADCGNYGSPPCALRWAVQLAQFSVCVVTARVLCGSVVITVAPLLAHIAAALDSAFRGHPTLLLYFVMVACPVLMNTGQAWLQDHFIKWPAWGPAGGGASTGALWRSDEGGDEWAELGDMPEAMLAVPGDVEDAPLASAVPGAAAGQAADHGARAAAAQRQKAPAAAAGSDRRLRPTRD